MHWQAAASLLLLQTALLPHGEGLQGSTGSGILGGAEIKVKLTVPLKQLSDLHVVILLHETKAFPVYPGSQVPVGL